MSFWFRTSRRTAPAQKRSVRLCLEVLESRLAPAIRLEVVALHEFGHSLGLSHDMKPKMSIMDPYYNDAFDINYFLSGADPAVAAVRNKFAKTNTSPWKDALDGTSDGVIHITYSFMLDGALLDGAAPNTLFETMNAKFGSPDAWQSIFKEALNNWSLVSNGKLVFVPYNGIDGDGVEAQIYNFNISGKAQNDSRFGDIRIGVHAMDGIEKVLAHAYLPTSVTAGGDAHFDSAELWGYGVNPITTDDASAGVAPSDGHDHGHGNDDDDDIEDQNMELPGESASNVANQGNGGIQLVVVQGMQTGVPVNNRFDLIGPVNGTTNTTAAPLTSAPPPASRLAVVTWYTADAAETEDAPAKPAPAPMEQRPMMAVEPMQGPHFRPRMAVAQFEDLYLPVVDTAAAATIIEAAPVVEPYVAVDRLNPGTVSALAALLVGAGCPRYAVESGEPERKRRSQPR